MSVTSQPETNFSETEWNATGPLFVGISDSCSSSMRNGSVIADGFPKVRFPAPPPTSRLKWLQPRFCFSMCRVCAVSLHLGLAASGWVFLGGCHAACIAGETGAPARRPVDGACRHACRLAHTTHRHDFGGFYLISSRARRCMRNQQTRQLEVPSDLRPFDRAFKALKLRAFSQTSLRWRPAASLLGSTPNSDRFRRENSQCLPRPYVSQTPARSRLSRREGCARAERRCSPPHRTLTT